MNFVADVSYKLIMKTLCVLAAVVVAATATLNCLAYCDTLYSGWKISRQSDCNCFGSQKKMQDAFRYKKDLKPILLPLQSQNRKPIFKNLPKNQDYNGISLTNNLFSGLGNNKHRQIEKNKIKRTSDYGSIPVKVSHDSSKKSDDVLNNTHINERNLSDCIDLHILINIRKNKKVVDLEPNTLKLNNNLNDLEINTLIKNKCDEAAMIIKQSVAEIKEHQKSNNNKKKVNLIMIPKKDTRSSSEETKPVVYGNENISNISTDKSTTNNDEFYTDTTTDKITMHYSEALYNFNFSTTLEDNIRNETTETYDSLKDLNDSVEIIMGDDNNTMYTADISSQSLIANTTITTPQNIRIPTDDKTYLSYKLTELQKKNLKDELHSEKSKNPVKFPERVENKSMLIAVSSDNVKESTSKTNIFFTNSNETVATKTINRNNNNISFRDRYNENDVPIVRIITREFSNDTISSVINGTEILPNSDFEEETTINNNNKTENTYVTETFKSIVLESGIQSRRNDVTLSTTEEQFVANKSPTINGRLFFQYEQKQIPGHFVQTPDGHLYLNLDLNTICKELNQKGKQDSRLISTFCQYLSL